MAAMLDHYDGMVGRARNNHADTFSFPSSSSLQGKCKHCGKAFPSKLGFGPSRLVVGYSCSWCKFSYHNKDNCLGPMVDDGVCDLGQFAKVIVPPSWIVKRPRKGSFKSSLKNSPNRHNRKKRAGNNLQ